MGVYFLDSHLHVTGILDDTIVVVASDNGGQICQDCGQSNYPLRGGKNTNFEGGVRTPALIVGPGVQSGIEAILPD